MWAIKILGSMLFIAGCGMFGMKKSAELLKRVKSIDRLIRFVTETAEQIRLCQDEADEILKRTLPDMVVMQNGTLLFNENLCLLNDEKEKVIEFVNGIGMLDAAAEYRRCFYYRQVLQAIKQEAYVRAAEKLQLYKTGGWMIGLALSFLWW